MTVVLNENMQKLVAALRSGKFKQAKGKLNRVTVPGYIKDAIENGNLEEDYAGDNAQTVGNCCLGVACEIAVADGIVDAHVVEDFDGQRVVSYGEYEEENFLPYEVADWLGFPDQRDLYFDMSDKVSELDDLIPSYTKIRIEDNNGKFFVQASDLNDRYDYTFDMIADLIEAGRLTPADEVPSAFRY